MDIDKYSLESCGVTRSPLDAYRGSGRHSKFKNPPLNTKPLSNITIVDPRPTYNNIDVKSYTHKNCMEYPKTIVLDIGK